MRGELRLTFTHICFCAVLLSRFLNTVGNSLRNRNHDDGWARACRDLWKELEMLLMKSDRIQRVLRSGGKGGNLRVKGCNHNRANCSFLRFCEDSALCDPNCNCPSAYICSKLRVWHCVLHLTHTNTVTRVCLDNKLFCSLSLGHSSLVKANFTVLLLRWDISFPFCVDTFRRDCMSVRDIPRNQHRYCCSGIMNEAAVQTLSVLAKQAKPAICYPMRCFPTESCVYLLCQISSLNK